MYVLLTDAAMYKVTGHLQTSTEIMKLSQRLIQIPQMTHAMRDMSAELMKVRCATLTLGGHSRGDDA